MFRLTAWVLGALLATGFAAEWSSAEAAGKGARRSSGCIACTARPTETRVSYRTVNHRRVVTTNRVVPRTTVVNHNRVILHKTVVRHRVHTVHRQNVLYRNVVVHRHNVGHRFATESRTSHSSSRQVNVRHQTVHRHVKGTECNCGRSGTRVASSAPRMKRQAAISSRY